MPRPSPSEFKNSAKNRRQLGKKHPSPRFNNEARKLRAAARSEGLASLSERNKKNAKSRRQLGKKHPSPRFNSVAVKDGRLRAAARPEGLTSSFERCKNAKSSHQLGAARAEKEGEGRKASCRLPFGRCSLPRSSCCCLGSADTIHIYYIYYMYNIYILFI